MPNNIHRGRIQAQGNGVEKSENWSQDDPLTAVVQHLYNNSVKK